MLVDEASLYAYDPILMRTAKYGGGPMEAVKLATGIYEIGHFGSSDYPLGSAYEWERYPELPDINRYGVCDNFQQILDACPGLVTDPDRKFFITLTRISKRRESPKWGWRWHKWGPYIGTQTPTTEYIYDEPVIEEVFVYHIYERKS